MSDLRRRWLVLAVCSVASVVPARAQLELGPLDRGAEAKKQHVELLSDAVQVDAGKSQRVELRFVVLPGFHINSHTPKDELLIPTVLKLGQGAVQESKETYPKGSAFRLESGGGQTLDVYQGEFRVGLEVVAPKGTSVMSGELRYQACDTAACYPPRTLAFKVAVTGR